MVCRKVHRASNVAIGDLNNCVYTCDKKPTLDFELRVIINQQNGEHNARTKSVLIETIQRLSGLSSINIPMGPPCALVTMQNMRCQARDVNSDMSFYNLFGVWYESDILHIVLKSQCTYTLALLKTQDTKRVWLSCCQH